MKTRKGKTKPQKSESAVEEMQNGLPSRVTSNGLVDDITMEDSTKLPAVASRTKKKSKSSKHDKTIQSDVSPHCKMKTSAEKQVKVSWY